MLFRCLDELEGEVNANGRRIAIRTAHAFRSLDIATIECLKVHGRRVEVVLTDGAVIESVESIGILGERLLANGCFFRCHRSYIVNVNHIKRFSDDGVTIRSGLKIPVARSCRSAFKERYFSVAFKDIEEPW